MSLAPRSHCVHRYQTKVIFNGLHFASIIQQILGRGHFSTVSLVQLLGGWWVAHKSYPQTPDNQRRMTLEQNLLEGAPKDQVANVRWALSTQIDAQQWVISFAMEVADLLTLAE